MSNKQVNYDKINYGFSLLKMFLAFEVLLGHFCNWKEYNMRFLWPFREFVSLAVPCFVILSFYLMEKSFLSRDDEKFKKRLIKLCIPQIGWAFIYYIVYVILDMIFHQGLHGDITALFWQCLTGHSRFLNATMWYQFDIIVISIIFHMIFKYIKENNKAYIALIGLALFSYFMQISGINMALFGEMEFELKFPLGRIFEMIPFAVIGFSVKYFNLYDRFKHFRYIIMPLCIFIFFTGFYIPFPEFKDFGFAGFTKPYMAICIVTFAYMVPLEYLSLNLKKFVLKLSNYSLGIYCIHRMINTMITVFIPDLPLRSFERCILLYIVCYGVCYLIDFIKNENVKLLIN